MHSINVCMGITTYPQIYTHRILTQVHTAIAESSPHYTVYCTITVLHITHVWCMQSGTIKETILSTEGCLLCLPPLSLPYIVSSDWSQCDCHVRLHGALPPV